MKTKHILDYCLVCRTEMVRCAVCNNPGCNGMSGEVNGEGCPACPNSWDVQSQYYKDKTSVEFEKDIRNTKAP